MYNHRLETFIQMADAGSFSKAGAAMHITPTAVIKQMNALEEELGVTLFVRTHRGLRLTKGGESLYKDSQYLIQFAKEAVARAKEAMDVTAKTIRIGTSLMTPGQFIVKIWENIRDSYGDMKFQLIPFSNTPENAWEILAHLGEHIDIVAGMYDEAFLASRQCTAFPLGMVPLCCGVSVNHRLAAKPVLTWNDLRGETIFLIQAGWNSYMDRLRREMTVHHPELKVVDFPFFNLDVFNRCANDEGILIGIQNWEQTHPLIKIIPVAWDFAVPFGILHHPEPSPQVAMFLEAIIKRL